MIWSKFFETIYIPYDTILIIDKLTYIDFIQQILKMDRILVSSHRTVRLRAKIIWLWLRGTSARSISHQTGASLTTVYRWIHRWKESRKPLKPYYSILNSNFPTRQKSNCIMSRTDKKFSSTPSVSKVMTQRTDGRETVHLSKLDTELSMPLPWNIELSRQQTLYLPLASLYRAHLLFCKASISWR